MSSGGQTIDKRKLEFDFDDQNFQSGVKSSLSTLEGLNRVLNNFDGSSINIGSNLGESLDEATRKTSIFDNALTQIATGALREIGARIEQIGEKIVGLVNPLKTLDFYIGNASAGWQKYADKTNAVQTIMSATRTQFKDEEEQFATVTEQLDKLNWFTDETSYSYMDMVNNIGKFTSNGVKLEEAVTAMEGISTWAAISGANVNEAGRAMYNLSQAMGVGAVTLMDWKSIENANMATVEFKETALATAAVMGKLQQAADGTYKTLDGDVVTLESFRDSLKEKWFDSDVLTTTLGIYGEFSDKLHEVQTTLGYESATPLLDALDEFMEKREDFDFGPLSEELKVDVETLKKSFNELGADEYDLGRRAFLAAQEARTFGQVIDSLKDALSTSFMGIFESIFGNLYEAKDLFSWLVEELYAMLVAPVKGLQKLMAAWHDLGGRLMLIDAIKNLWNSFKDILGAVGKAFSEVFPKTTAEGLVELTKRFELFTEKLKPSEGLLTAITTATKVFIGILAGKGIGAVLKFALGLTKLLNVKNLVIAFAVWLSTLKPVADFLASVQNAVYRLYSSLITMLPAITEFADRLKNAFLNSAIGKRLTGWFENVKKSINDFLTTSLQPVTDWFNKLGKFDLTKLNIEGWVKNISDKLMIFCDWLSVAWDWLSGLPAKFTALKASISETDAFKKFIDTLKDIKNILSVGYVLAIDFIRTQFEKLGASVSKINWTNVFTTVLNILTMVGGAVAIVAKSIIDTAVNVYSFISKIGIGDFFGSIIDAFKSFISSGPSLENIVTLLKGIGTAFGEVFGNIKDRLLNGEFRATVLVRDWAKGFVNAIVDKFKSFGDKIFGGVSGILRGIVTRITSIKDGIVNFFPNLSNKLGEFKDKLADKFLSPFKRLHDAVQAFSFDNLFRPLTNSLNSGFLHKLFTGEFFKPIFESDLFQAMKPYIDRLGQFLKNISGPLNEFFGTDLGKIVPKILLGFGFLMTFRKFVKGLLGTIKNFFDGALELLKLVKKPIELLDNLKEITEKLKKLTKDDFKTVIQDLLDNSIGKLLNAKARKENMLALLAFAGAVALFATAFWLLADLPIEKFENAVLMVSAITVAVGGLAYALSKFEASRAEKLVGKGLIKIGNGLKGIGKGLKRIGTGITIAAFALAVAAIAGVFLLLKKTFEGGWTDEMALAGIHLIGFMAALATAMKFLDGTKIGIGTGVALVGMAVALALLVIPLKVLTMMDPDQVKDAGIAIGILLLALSASSQITKPSGMVAISVGLLALAGAMILLVPQLMLLSLVDASGVLMVIGLITALTFAMLILGEAKGKFKALISLSVGLLALGAALTLIAPALLQLNELNGFTGLISIVSIIGAVTVAVAALGRIKGAAKGMAVLSIGLLAVAGAMAILAPVLMVLGSNLDYMWTFVGILGALVAAGFIAGLGPVAAGLFALSAAMVAIGVAALGIGVGLSLAVTAILSLVDAIRQGTDDVEKNKESFSNALTTFIVTGLEALTKNASMIIGAIADFFVNTLVTSIEKVRDSLGKIIDVVNSLIGEVARQLSAKGGAIWDAVEFLLLTTMDFILEGMGRILVTIGEKIGGPIGDKIKDAGKTMQSALDDEVKAAEKHFNDSQSAEGIGKAIKSRINSGLKSEPLSLGDIITESNIDWVTLLSPTEENKGDIQDNIYNCIATELGDDKLSDLRKFFNENTGPKIIEQLGGSLDDLAKSGDISAYVNGAGELIIEGLNKASLDPNGTIGQACDANGKAVITLAAAGLTKEQGLMVAAGITAYEELNKINLASDPRLAGVRGQLELNGNVASGTFVDSFASDLTSEQSREEVQKAMNDAMNDPASAAGESAGLRAAKSFKEIYKESLEGWDGSEPLVWDKNGPRPISADESSGNIPENGRSGGKLLFNVKGLADQTSNSLLDAMKNSFMTGDGVKDALGKNGLFGAIEQISSTMTGDYKKAAQPAVDGIASTFADAANVAKVTKSSKSLFEAGVNAAKTYLEISGEAPSMLMSRIGNYIVIGTSNGINEKTQEFIDNLVSKFKEGTDEVLKFLEMGAAGNSSELYDSIGQGILFGLMDGLEAQRPALMSLMESIFGEMYYIGERRLSEFFVLGYRIGEAIAQGAGTAGSLVHQAGANLFWEFYAGICEAAQIHSPSRVMMEVGNYLGQGMAVGVEGSVDEVEEAARSMIDQTIAGVSNAIMNINDAIYSGIDTTPVIRPVVDLTDVQNGLGSVNDAFGSATLQAKQVPYTPSVTQNSRLLSALDTMSRKSDKEDKEPAIGVLNITIAGDNKNAEEIAEEVRQRVVMELQRGRAVWA